MDSESFGSMLQTFLAKVLEKITKNLRNLWHQLQEAATYNVRKP
jgi:hypothetical protein